MSGFNPQEVVNNLTDVESQKELDHWKIVLANRLDTKIRSENPNK